MKPRYIVMVEKSGHQNYTNAEANKEALDNQGQKARVVVKKSPRIFEEVFEEIETKIKGRLDI